MLPLREYRTLDGWVREWHDTSRRRIAHIVGLDIAYSMVYSAAAGIGNAVTEAGEKFASLFEQGFFNHSKMALWGNLLYPLVFSKLRKSKHYRLYANLFCGGMLAIFSALHYIIGTDNPMETMMAINAPAGFVITNAYVSITNDGEE